MFQQLERVKQELDILNFGLDLTTMDDVFLKIGELEEAGDTDDDGEAEPEDKPGQQEAGGAGRDGAADRIILHLPTRTQH